jgi:hypothetical protein
MGKSVMARFQGMVNGQNSSATRIGHERLETIAASHQGCVRVELYTVGDTDHARVCLDKRHGAGNWVGLYDGPIQGAVKIGGRTISSMIADVKAEGYVIAPSGLHPGRFTFQKPYADQPYQVTFPTEAAAWEAAACHYRMHRLTR